MMQDVSTKGKSYPFIWFLNSAENDQDGRYLMKLC